MREANEIVAFIKEREGCRLEAYMDGGGVWTLGYGATRYANGARVKEGDECTQEQADAWVDGEVAWRVSAVNAACKVKPTPDQLLAMVSLVYNIGLGAFRTSTLLKRHNAGLFVEAGNQFRRWNKDRHPVTKQLREVPGLTKRREMERAIYLRAELAASKDREYVK